MLENKVMIYDDSCPMCALYTQAFVRMRLLKPEHRVGFAAIRAEQRAVLDLKRARHEIPLLDTETGEVIYGIDAMFLVLAHRFPVLRLLFRLRPFRGACYFLYQIVTYNRRVIAGTHAPCTGFDCAPDFNLPFRLLYLVLALGGWLGLVAGVVRGGVLFAPLIAGFALVQAALFVLLVVTRRGWNWASNFATNCLLFGLLLVPVLMFALPGWLVGVNTALAVVTTLLDLRRRIRNLA